MDKVTNKDNLERTVLPSMEDLLIRKNLRLDWTPHEDVTRQATKVDSLLSTVFWSPKERASSSSVQGYRYFPFIEFPVVDTPPVSIGYLVSC